MFFILSKTLDLVLLPYTWIVALTFCTVLFKNKRRKQIAGFVLLSVLLILGNKPFVNYLFQAWETAPQSIANLPDKSTAIVLTGITNLNKEPFDRVFFQKGADRITQTLMLYRRGKVNKIIITGGSGKLLEKGQDEAHVLKSFLLDCQVPDSVIYIEDAKTPTKMQRSPNNFYKKNQSDCRVLTY